jgi:hypothetical protein
VRPSNKKLQAFQIKTDVASGEKFINKSLMIANKIAEKLKNFPTNLVDKNVSNAANLISFSVNYLFYNIETNLEISSNYSYFN